MKNKKELGGKCNPSKILYWILVIGFISSSVLLMICRTRTVLLSDTCWHIKVGEYITKHGVPHIDMFSVHNGLKFMAHEWLFDVGIYFIDKKIGYIGLTILVFTGYFIGYFYSCTYSRKNQLFKSGLVLLFVLSGLHKTAAAIPDTIAMLFMLFGISIMLKRTSLKRKLLANGIVVLVLVNIHGGMFSTYIVQLCILLIIDVLYRNKTKIKEFLPIIIETFIVGMINPYGLKIYSYAINMLFTNETQYLEDWQRFGFGTLSSIVVFVVCFSFMFIGNDKLNELDELDVEKYGLLLFWIILNFFYIRCVNIMTMVLIMLGGDWIKNGMIIVSNKFKINKIRNAKKAIKCFQLVVIFIVMVFSIAFTLDICKRYKGSTNSFIASEYITEEMQKYLKQEEVKMFNVTDIGGYLIYCDIPVFIDGRTDPYLESFGNPSILKDSIKAMYDFDEMEKLYNSYGFNTLVLQNDRTYSEIYKNSTLWETVYQTNEIIILKRKVG